MEPAAEPQPTSQLENVRAALARKWQYWVDRSVLYTKSRWIGLAVALVLFALRIYMLNGWFIVAYGLGIFLLNLLIGFVSPQEDPEAADDVALPLKVADEFRPFVRKVPEFKFWYSAAKGTVMSFLMTTSDLFDVPVFWPILLGYFLLLFGITLKTRIEHMRKHGYVPWSFGKKKYAEGGPKKDSK